MNNGVVRTGSGNDRVRRLLASKEPPYAKIQKYENDVDSEVGYETIPGGGGGGVGRRRGNSEYDPGYEELAQPASSSSPMSSSPRLPPNHRQVPDQQQQQHQQFPTEDGNHEIELDNSVNSAGQSSLIQMSVQQSVTEVPDTPGFSRRSSVVVIEHVVEGGGVTSAGVSDVDGHLADEGSPSAGDKNVHIFV